MAQLFRNNAFSNLGASLTNVATTLTVTAGHGDLFPVVTAPDFCLLTLQDASNNIEIVKVTARTSGSDSMTIVRAQEGTTARSWNIGDVVELRLTAFALNPLSLLEGSATAAAVRAILDVPTRAGGDASGTWNISISGNAATATSATTAAACSGNAATATALQTARTINGTSFDGSANITTANWGTARTITIGNTAKSVNGSADVSWSLAEIGAAAATATVNLTGDQTIGGIKSFSSVIGVGGQAGTSAQWTTVGWTRAISMANGQCLWWPKGTNAVSKGIGSTADNNIYFAASTADSGAGVTYPFIFDMSAGNFIATGNVTAYSDIRLKTDLQPIPEALTKVKALTGYTYTRTDSGERQTGLVAQDVQRVLPEAVIEGEHLSLAYGNLVGLLVEAIKEQARQIEALTARVEKLEGC